MKSEINKLNLPCNKCPYKLGLIKTLINPCPKCKMTNYSTYKEFIKQMDKGEKHED